MYGLCLPTRRIPSLAAYFLLGLLVLTDAIAALPSDRDALVAFKESLSAGVPNNWVGDPCAGWQGVNCSEQGRVVQLSLDSQGLQGTIPAQLGTLSQLTHLSFKSNQLDGPIPPQLGNLSRLTYLDAQNNKLSGNIPVELTRLFSLKTLDLSINNLNGTIPSEIGSLTALVDLQLYSNSLTGHIPASLGNVPNLANLLLYDNQLEGAVPLTWLNSNLKTLDLSNNRFVGSIPDQLGSLTALTAMNLSINNLTGTIPRALSNLLTVTTLDLSRNSFSDSIPPELGTLSALTTLDLSHNRLTGPIPGQLGNLLAVVNLSHNNLVGPIPDNVNWDQLSDLSNNFLNGSVPARLSSSRVALNCLNLETGDVNTNSQRNSTECSERYPGVSCFCASPKVWGLDGLCHCVTPLQFQALFTAPDRQSLGNFTANLNNTHRQLAAAAFVTDRQVALLSYRYSQSLLARSVKLNFSILPLTRSSFSAEQETSIRAKLSATTNVTVPFFNQGLKLLSASRVVSSSRNVKRIVLAVGTSSIIALLLALVFLVMLWRRRTFKRRSTQNFRFNIPDTSVKYVLLSDLKRATDSFNESHRIGEGGFGDVYKGHLAGTPVAIKKLKVGSQQGWDEFEKELTTIGSIHNRNLVKLLGYCVDGEELLLVYEFMANGSLQDALSAEGGVSLDWEQCKHIMVGTAYAIAYLHGGCSPRIIHRDIKPANILLDQNFEAKVSDFGLARATPIDDTHVTTAVKGTLWYLAPEYVTTGQLTEKSDVYSFGMVMLVVISQSGLWCTMGESAIGIRLKAFRLAQQRRQLELLAPRFADVATPDEASRFISVALLCIHPTTQLRPSMERVVQMLQGAMDIPPMNMPAIEAYISAENQSLSSDESST